MLAKWFGSIDFGKWTVNTSSGFVVTAAVLFFIDSLVPGHLTEEVFTDLSAGKIIVFGLVAIVSSSILGLAVDSIFHSFGRYFAAAFWGPLYRERVWRNKMMQSLGYGNAEFEWMYAQSPGKLSDTDVEKDYLRFTEVAGCIGYALVLLFAPVIYMFLRLEYGLSFPIALTSSILSAVGGIVLVLTSAASLRKYESRKTSVVLEYLRKSSINPNTNEIDKETDEEIKCKLTKRASDRFSKINKEYASTEEDQKRLAAARVKLAGSQKEAERILKSYWTPSLWWLSLIVFAAAALLAGAAFPTNIKLSEENTMKTIALSENATADKGVPTLNITVTMPTPNTSDTKQTKSAVVVINNFSDSPKMLELVKTDLVQFLDSSDNSTPKWKLSVSLYDSTSVSNGDRIYVIVSFDSNGKPITEGEWLFPIVVREISTDPEKTNQKYLLGQVSVKITASETKPAADKTSTTGSKLDIHIV